MLFYSDWALTAFDAQFIQTNRLDHIPPLITRTARQWFSADCMNIDALDNHIEANIDMA